MIQIPLTPEQFHSRAVKIASEQGIQLVGHGGMIEKMGVKASYLYADGILSINILEKPGFLSEDMVESQLKAWM